MKYTVEICRKSYAYRDVIITAENEKEAKDKADELAGDLEYNEDVEYSFRAYPYKGFWEMYQEIKNYIK